MLHTSESLLHVYFNKKFTNLEYYLISTKIFFSFLALHWLDVVRENETAEWPPSFFQALVGGCAQGHKEHSRGFLGGQEDGDWRGWFGEVEFEVPGSQDAQSKLRRTTKMEHKLRNCQYSDGNWKHWGDGIARKKRQNQKKRAEEGTGGTCVVGYKFPFHRPARVDFLGPESSARPAPGAHLTQRGGAYPRPGPSPIYHLDLDLKFSHSPKFLAHIW